MDLRFHWELGTHAEIESGSLGDLHREMKAGYPSSSTGKSAEIQFFGIPGKQLCFLTERPDISLN